MPTNIFVSLPVQDPKKSKAFYDKFFSQLGWKTVYEDSDAGGYSDGNFTVWVVQAEKKGKHEFKAPGFHHFAVRVNTKEKVDAFYEWAKKEGIEIVDPPALYEKYNKDYYAVFVLDPDGMKLEVVYNPVPGI